MFTADQVEIGLKILIVTPFHLSSTRSVCTARQNYLEYCKKGHEVDILIPGEVG